MSCCLRRLIRPPELKRRIVSRSAHRHFCLRLIPGSIGNWRQSYHRQNTSQERAPGAGPIGHHRPPLNFVGCGGLEETSRCAGGSWHGPSSRQAPPVVL